jgi:trans-aconitate methyltransferase
MKNIDLSRRNISTQLMDSADTDFEIFRACLVDLSKVNYLTLAYRPTLRFFEHLARSGRLPSDRTVNVVDVGSGFGDMVRKIDRWAVRRGFKVDLTGIDQNPLSVPAAEEVPALGRPIRFVTADIFAYQPSSQVDIVISSQMTHQMDDTSLIRFISWMEANAAIGWFVNDLRRNAIPYHLFDVASRALRFHEFVQHDGPVSIACAFDVGDWRRLLDSAGIPRATAKIGRAFPYRLCVSRLKT